MKPWTEKAKNSFWAKVDRRGPNECWPWLRSKGTTGYGQVNMGTHSKAWRSHRVAYILANGPITGNGSDSRGVCVLHTCDNRACCNPNHLRLGTHAENLADMIAKGRNKLPPRVTPEMQRRNDAYPKLVEALREVAGGQANAFHAARILRELGEAE